MKVRFFYGNVMTLSQARKILGKIANNIPDDELQKEIDVALLLKDLFFDNLLKTKNKPTPEPLNVP